MPSQPNNDTPDMYPNLINFIPDDGRPAREHFAGDVNGVLREIALDAVATLETSLWRREGGKSKGVGT